jgi:thiosulfate/3-mercaptopyruvate sulfurtransferase
MCARAAGTKHEADPIVARLDPLISPDELAEALAGDEPPVVIDVRWRLGGPPGLDSYRDGHVPGAVYVDLDTQLAGPPGERGRHPLPATPDFEAAMRAAGVRSGRNVVVCDEADSTTAARAWWMLRYYGHDEVRVLDGGFRAWAAAGLPVSTDDPADANGPADADEMVSTHDSVPGKRDFTAHPGRMPVLDAASAGTLARSGVLLDARAPARYRGQTEPVDRVAGHIPGALSAPTAENVTADGRFRPVAELRARFAELGIKAADDPGADDPGADDPGAAASSTAEQVGVYCGSGVTAAHELLALTLAGIPAALYVGSWSDWIADPSRPVATGPQPG